MAKIELVMPKMGESIIEATILNWVKNVGDKVEEDETILEIATDKVDSEIPSPVDGTIKEILFNVDDVVPVGTVIAIIETTGEETGSVSEDESKPDAIIEAPQEEVQKAAASLESDIEKIKLPNVVGNIQNSQNRFYSPLVKNIAKEENITQDELDNISGSGANGRVTKQDVLSFLEQRTKTPNQIKVTSNDQDKAAPVAQAAVPKMSFSSEGNVEIIEMDRMRRLIADHMVMSKHTSPHVTSFVEADVTNLVNWRNGIKKEYVSKYGEKITFTPIILEAVIKALVDFPMVNVSVDGKNVIVKKDINVGMAAALPSGNLIVPVIKNANMLNLNGLVRSVNDLATRARANKLKPEEIQGGTFTVTNVGTFGNVMGTPIINQPQVAILAAGAIRKRPAVLETEHGDVIAIRHMMFLSLSYDHRVVDGFLGGSFLKRISDYLEGFDGNRGI